MQIVKSVVGFVLLNTMVMANNMAIIHLDTQTIEIIDSKGNLLLHGAISSGNRNHKTPRGVFKILQKERYHKSNLYPINKDGTRGGAKMNYMLKFTNQGNAIHQGNVVFEGDSSIPVSHGCVRLTPYDAQSAFNLLKVGDTVKVVGRYDYEDSFNSKLSENDMIVIDDGVYDEDIGDSNGLNITFSDWFLIQYKNISQ